MSNTYIRIVLILTLATCIISCKKFVELQAPPQLIESSAVFSDESTALSAVTGVYLQIRSTAANFASAGLSIYPSLSADELYNTAANTTYDPFITNNILATHTTLTTFWTVAYRTIYRTNAIIEGLSASSGLADSVKAQLIGEMKTVRAFHYFYLVNLFGDVPLVTSSNYQLNAIMPRTRESEIYAQIEADLLQAKTGLKEAYPTAGKARPNKYTALALLARVYLYKKDWAQAGAAADEVINAGKYSLVTNLNNVFLINSAETIWELAPANESANNPLASTYVPSSATVKPAFALTPQLLSAFETGDGRKTAWLKSNTVGGTAYFYPNKFKNRTANPPTEYHIMLRLSELFLIRAEAKAWQNNLAGAVADLNLLRSRAGLTALTATSQSSLLAAIDKERQVELFTEWGDRWLNLKRRSNADAVLSSVKGANWQPHDKLYPIPQAELEYNVFLTQNPGY
jgi:hypothetical protein